MKKEEGFSLIELLIVVIIIMIIAAIAIPSLLRARISANESGVIGDTRTVLSASHAYASANGGLFEGALSCLTDPDACIPAYPTTAPTFLDSNIANLMFKSGYNRTLEPGPTVPAAQRPAQSSLSSVMSYAYTSSPANIGRTGVRGFGGDSSGVLCTCQTGCKPPTAGGGLISTPTTCEILQ